MLGDLTETELRATFALHAAQAMLLVGSRADGLDYPGSDVDFLAVYGSDAEFPAEVACPHAVRSDSSLGRNWIGTLHGEEVNVECVSLRTLLRVSAIALSPLTARRTAVLQPLEIRLLGRLSTGLPVGGSVTGAQLVGPEPLHRLPAVAFTMHYLGVTSHLELARGSAMAADSLGGDLVLLVAASGLGLAALAVRDVVVYAPKKIGLALRRLECEGRDAPVREADLRALLSAGYDPATRLRVADEALRRVCAAVVARGDADGGAWAEAAGAIAG
jgi:hypothetical protein